MDIHRSNADVAFSYGVIVMARLANKQACQ
jgi:hypothetical protein